jgi:hypothetical protein
MADLRVAALRNDVSMNEFLVQAVAEKLEALRAQGLLGDITPDEQIAYLKARAARSQRATVAELVKKAGTTNEVLPGDEIPEGWLSDCEPRGDAAVRGPGRPR